MSLRKQWSLGIAFAALTVALAPAASEAQRTPANLTTNRVEFRRPVRVDVCLATVQNLMVQNGWGSVNVNNNQTVMGSRTNVVLHVICTPWAAFVGAAGSGVSPAAFVDELTDAITSSLNP